MPRSFVLLITACLAMAAEAQHWEQYPPEYTIFTAGGASSLSNQESRYETYRSVEEFVARWPRSSDCDTACTRAMAAKIDFERRMLVLIAPRGRDSYDVVVSSVTMGPSHLDVRFIELRHGEARGDVLCGVVATAPRPGVSFLVGQTSKPLRFFRERADVLCEADVEVSQGKDSDPEPESEPQRDRPK